MPIVAAKCTQCGQNLQLDSDSKKAQCPYCKTSFVVQDAINHYITNNYIHGEHVHVHDEKSVENRLKSAETFLTKHHDKREALRIFEEVCSDAPYNYRCWWGKVRVYTEELTRTDFDRKQFIYIQENAERAFNVASGEELAHIKNMWDQYKLKLFHEDAPLKQKRSELNEQRNGIHRKMDSPNSQKAHYMQMRNTEQEKWRSLDKEKKEIEAQLGKMEKLSLSGMLPLCGKLMLAVMVCGVVSWFIRTSVDMEQGIAYELIGAAPLILFLAIPFAIFIGIVGSAAQVPVRSGKLHQVQKQMQKAEQKIYAINQEIQKVDQTINMIRAEERRVADQINSLDNKIRS